MQVVTIGLDIAKHVFQVHGADATGKPVLKQRVRRGQVLDVFRALPPCIVGIEACATAHHWARELRALGHDVRLMPPAYVKPYVKRQKNDAADAEAICEAVSRPTMRFGKRTPPALTSCGARARIVFCAPPGRTWACRTGRWATPKLVTSTSAQAGL